jgi:hypothetical protein
MFGITCVEDLERGRKETTHRLDIASHHPVYAGGSILADPVSRQAHSVRDDAFERLPAFAPIHQRWSWTGDSWKAG